MTIRAAVARPKQESVMRPINVSTDVYAAVWAARQPGEDTENDILERLLGVKKLPQPKANGAPPKIGFSDSRFGIELPEGFEVFRVYKNKEFRAVAKNGKWELQGTGETFPSFNQLSRGIGAGTENAWQNWYYKGADGSRKLVTSLRP
jgi:hypothetical protein